MIQQQQMPTNGPFVSESNFNSVFGNSETPTSSEYLFVFIPFHVTLLHHVSYKKRLKDLQY